MIPLHPWLWSWYAWAAWAQAGTVAYAAMWRHPAVPAQPMLVPLKENARVR